MLRHNYVNTMIIKIMQIEFIQTIRVDNKVDLITTVNTINQRMRAQASWYMRKKKTEKERGRERSSVPFINS